MTQLWKRGPLKAHGAGHRGRTMKYFEVGDEQFTSIRSLRKHLSEHPDIQSVVRYWWSGSDLIDCERISRDDILSTKANALTSGMTAQWACSHGRL